MRALYATPAIMLCLWISPTSTPASVLRLQPVVDGKVVTPKAEESVPYAMTVGSFTVIAQASVVQDLALVKVHIDNNSNHSLQVSPVLFSAADGHKLMLKALPPIDVTTILQADMAILRADTSPSAPPTTNPLVDSLATYFFGRIGLHGPDAALVGNVTGALVNSMTEPISPSIAPPVVTPAMVAREALENSNLKPSYSAEGILFFTSPNQLPLTVLVDLDGKNASVVFDLAVSSESVPAGDSMSKLGAGSAPLAEFCKGGRKLKSMARLDDVVESLRPGQVVRITCVDGSSSRATYADYDVSGNIWVVLGNPPKRRTISGRRIAKITVER